MASETETLKKDMADLRSALESLTKDMSSLSKTMTENMKDSVQETNGELKQKAQKLVEQAREKGKHSAEVASTAVSENPFRSILISFGAGILISQLIRRH